MSISSNGNENRVAGRNFNENKIAIERFDGSHTINVAIPSEKYDDRPLVKAQRKELNCWLRQLRKREIPKPLLFGKKCMPKLVLQVSTG